MDINSVECMVDSILKGISYNDQRFYTCLDKWKPLLISTVNKICGVTGGNPEDILQEILVGMVKVNGIYNVPLYRYKKRLWEKKRLRKGRLLLVTPRYNREKPRQVWAPQHEVVPVKKGKLQSSLYRELNQCCYDMISSFFTQKNGYKKQQDGKRLVKVGSGKDRMKLVTKSVSKVTKIIETVDVNDEVISNSIGIDDNAESNMIYAQYMNNLLDSISVEATMVLSFMMDNSSVRPHKVSNGLGMSLKQVKFSMCEIERSIPFMKNQEDECIPYVTPIYVRADQV